MTAGIAISRPARVSHRRNWTPVILLAPAVALLLLIFAAPLANGVVSTFRKSEYGILGGFTFDSWLQIFQSEAYLDTLIRTLIFAGAATILCVVIGFPVAYHIVFRSKSSSMLTLLVIVPLLLNAVVLGLGWIIVLNSNGLVNFIYKAVSGATEPLQLLYTPGAVIVGLTFVYMPYVIITLVSSLRGLDTRIIQSAMSLGASPARAFWDVTVPLSMPGILSGAVLVFTLSAGVFIIPAFLGGSRLSTLPLLAYQQVTATLNFPLAIATAFVLLIILAVVTSIITRAVEGGRYKEVFRRAQV